MSEVNECFLTTGDGEFVGEKALDDHNEHHLQIMAFTIRQRPSLSSANLRGSNTRQQLVLSEQVQSIDFNTELVQRTDRLAQGRVAGPHLQDRFETVVDNDFVTNGQMDLVNDFVNQQHIDPMLGFDYGALDQAMNQYDKFMQIIQDQAVYNTNTGQGDYTTTTTQGDGYTTTTVTNSNGETRQSYTKHDSGHSRDQSSTGDVTHRDANGNIISEQEYCEETEKRANDCPDEKKSGDEQGSSNGNGGGSDEKIIAETE